LAAANSSFSTEVLISLVSNFSIYKTKNP
jgi:hypothetical protein